MRFSFPDTESMEAIAARFERTSTPSYKLLHAVNTGDTASVSTLLSTPDVQSFINTPNESGCTPLHLAVVKSLWPSSLHNAASYNAGVSVNGISLSSVTEQLIDARYMNLQERLHATLHLAPSRA